MHVYMPPTFVYTVIGLGPFCDILACKPPTSSILQVTKSWVHVCECGPGNDAITGDVLVEEIISCGNGIAMATNLLQLDGLIPQPYTVFPRSNAPLD